MCDGRAERSHDGVAHDAGDRSTEALDLCAHDVSALGSKTLDVLRIQPLRHRREAGKVGKKDGGYAPFFYPRTIGVLSRLLPRRYR